MTDREIQVSLNYDMRAHPDGVSHAELYRAAIDQCAWADERGFASVVLSEHHGSADGYLPSPIVLAAAISGASRNLLIRISVLLLPLYHPVRLAEDLAVLDLAAGGRLRLGVGAGYRPEEYEAFGLEIRRRPSLMERGIAVLKQAWTGEPFELDGRRVHVTPRPAQRPRPAIALGGASPASARRAARIADDYQAMAERLDEIYLETLTELGKQPPPGARQIAGSGPSFVHVTHDPERDWATIGPHALFESNAYAEWIGGARGGAYAAATDADELRARGKYLLLTPDEAVEFARTNGSLTLKPLMGGMDPELGWASLRLTTDEVLPRLGISAGPSPQPTRQETA